MDNITQYMKKKLNSFAMTDYRIMLGIKTPERVRNTNVLASVKSDGFYNFLKIFHTMYKTHRRAIGLFSALSVYFRFLSSIISFSPSRNAEISLKLVNFEWTSPAAAVPNKQRVISFSSYPVVLDL